MSRKGYVLLKTDSNGDPVFVSQKQYKAIMGETKDRSKRNDGKKRVARKKSAKQARKRQRSK